MQMKKTIKCFGVIFMLILILWNAAYVEATTGPRINGRFDLIGQDPETEVATRVVMVNWFYAIENKGQTAMNVKIKMMAPGNVVTGPSSKILPLKDSIPAGRIRVYLYKAYTGTNSSSHERADLGYVDLDPDNLSSVLGTGSIASIGMSCYRRNTSGNNHSIKASSPLESGTLKFILKVNSLTKANILTGRWEACDYYIQNAEGSTIKKSSYATTVKTFNDYFSSNSITIYEQTDPNGEWYKYANNSYADGTPTDTRDSQTGCPLGQCYMTWEESSDIAINVPTGTNYSYDGEEHTGVAAGTGYTLTGTTQATEVGTYTVTAKLETGYVWTGNQTGDKTITWKINKAAATISVTNYEGTYDGESHGLTSVSSTGGTLKYSLDGGTTWKNYTSTAYPTRKNAGTTTVNLKVVPDSNHTEKTATGKIIIAKQDVIKPTISGTYKYTGEQQTPSYNNFDSDLMEASNYKRTEAGTQNVTISLKEPDNYKWKNGNSEDITLSWTIAKRSATVKAKDQTITYGQDIDKSLSQATCIIEATAPTGHELHEVTLTGSPLTVTTSGTITPSNPKIYANGEDVSSNYSFDCQTGTLTVIKAALTKPTLTGTYTYNGSAQTAQLLNFDSTTMNITGNVKTDAGTYTITISLKDKTNYRWDSSTANDVANVEITDWTIDKKDIETNWNQPSGFAFECENGVVKCPTATADSGVTGETIKLTITGGSATVGTFTATAAISEVTGGQHNINNYNLTNTTLQFIVQDTIKPTINVTQNTADWTKESVVFTVTAADGGTGVNKVEYSFDLRTWKNEWDTGSTATNSKKTWTTEQNNIIYFRSTDNVGNISEVSGPYNIKIDKTPPIVTLSKDPDSAWTNQDVKISISAEDNFALNNIKLDNVEVTDRRNLATVNGLVINAIASKSVSQNGTYTVVVNDLAGNSTTQSINVANIDKIAPTITTPTEVWSNSVTFTLKDDVAPNSKMKFFAVTKNGNIEPTTMGNGDATEGNLLDYYYQVPNEASVNFTFKFIEKGTYYLWARDLAGNYTKKEYVLNHPILIDDYLTILPDAAGEYIYDGQPKEPDVKVVVTEHPSYTLVEGTDYEKFYEDNTNAGMATVKVVGIGFYEGTASKQFKINQRELVIKPDEGQSKLTGVDDPVFSYTYSNNVVGETPDFTGNLSRVAGESPGNYDITIGSLGLKDNDKFLANNYKISFVEHVKFLIDNFGSLITTWKVPAGGTIVLPIPSNAKNDYMISWGDGKSDKITNEGFPTHTYSNTAEKEYTIRVCGVVKTFGYINDLKPTTTNAASNYVTFNDYLVKIVNFGETEAERYGFSYCTKLKGPIPERTDFSRLTSCENMFNECTSLNGTIPSGFFASIPNLYSARNAFKNCNKLTGTLDTSLFNNSIKIKSFEGTFRGCTNITGTIPENMFLTNVNVESFAGVFAGMTKITGEIPEKLFSNKTVLRNVSEAFANDTKLTKIPEDLFKNNTLITNFYRTFYKCTGITEIPKNLFINNTIGKISNNSLSDYRGTFEGCTGLTSLELDVLFIGKEMFKNCNKIEKVLLPSVIELGDEAFYGCNKLTKIKIFKDNFAITGDDAFEFTGTPKPLLTYVNIDNPILLNYPWSSDYRKIDKTAPTGTVKIVTPKYPFTKTESISLQITVTDDISRPEDCYIAILNDTAVRALTPEELEKYREIDNIAIAEAIANGSETPESQWNAFHWTKYKSTADWTLSNGEGIKKVYVYFMDEMGNISCVTQDLEIE